ncbi:MAG: APC family permease [Anaerolineae bacterium]|jgi:amino acid transporter
MRMPTIKARDVKRFLIGERFPTSRELHERLDTVRGLAVFASDTISSNAYATEAIMSVLILLGSAALRFTLPLALAVASLILMVVYSYIQTIYHYPSGGGAYMVAKDNLGRYPSLVAGAALLIDYVMTVAVSTSAGVRAVTSAFPETSDYRVLIALTAITLISWVNLRGVRESGTIFAVPTYAFFTGTLVVIAIGLVRHLGLFGAAPLPVSAMVVPPQRDATGLALIWLLLRAFSGGCTALTGIEAISNGVQAFKPPEARHATTTMVLMAVIAVVLFLGISFLATTMHLAPVELGESILSQLTRNVVGSGFLYYWVQVFTALILFLAANTGFQDFPRLSFFMAREGFMPRWMQNRGDRLVYSSGIIVLALISATLVIVFRADEIAMLPLYALGVMLSFCLSQAGMSQLMARVGKLSPGETLNTGVTTVHYEPNWHWKRALNIAGSITTGAVFIVLVATKFAEGAWMVVLALPLFVYGFERIHHHYERVAKALSVEHFDERQLNVIANVAIVPIGDIHRGTLLALQYARRIASDVRAVSIATSPEARARVEQRWQRFPSVTAGLSLVVLDYEYRDLLEPLVNYITRLNATEFPDHLVTVVIPEFLPSNRLARLLHNRTASFLRRALREHPDIIIIDVPIHVGDRD